MDIATFIIGLLFEPLTPTMASIYGADRTDVHLLYYLSYVWRWNPDPDVSDDYSDALISHLNALADGPEEQRYAELFAVDRDGHNSMFYAMHAPMRSIFLFAIDKMIELAGPRRSELFDSVGSNDSHLHTFSSNVAYFLSNPEDLQPRQMTMFTEDWFTRIFRMLIEATPSSVLLDSGGIEESTPLDMISRSVDESSRNSITQPSISILVACKAVLKTATNNEINRRRTEALLIVSKRVSTHRITRNNAITDPGTLFFQRCMIEPRMRDLRPLMCAFVSDGREQRTENNAKLTNKRKRGD